MMTKNLFFIIGGFLLPSFLFGQFNYSVGSGLSFNFGNESDLGYMPESSKYSYCFNSSISYQKGSFRGDLGLSWETFKWIHIPTGITQGPLSMILAHVKDDGETIVFESYKARINYLILNPNIEAFLYKNISIGIGGLLMVNVRESEFDFISEEWSVLSSKLSANYDFGFNASIDYYFGQNFGIYFSYNRGFRDVFSLGYVNILRIPVEGDVVFNNHFLKLGFQYYFRELN